MNTETIYFILIFCVVGVGYTSYNIGLKEGINIGAGLMFEKFWTLGKPRKRDPNVRVVEMTKEEIILK